ncbi:hypothetical protein GUJ93_ZPchr0010g9919 [Zizania palustris]|uniref:Uncharacterized protein n=1 Tax=Zizania palustris TaxID=103762 RepID=A0A8J6BP73_ZIZPA|nr:hypothetical protein GUJ93_ZPchr0010g9919 [Zizania palustris]
MHALITGRLTLQLTANPTYKTLALAVSRRDRFLRQSISGFGVRQLLLLRAQSNCTFFPVPTMSRAMQQRRHDVEAEAAAAAGGVPRRRFDDDEPTTAGAAGCRCRSCAAVMLADCIALGCCPCAVVSMLSLALVKAPIVVGRRCVGRLRSRRRTLLRNKRIGDVALKAATACDDVLEKKATAKAEAAADVFQTASSGEAVAADDEDEEWLEEMYRTGHWGFGRVSFSGKNP